MARGFLSGLVCGVVLGLWLALVVQNALVS